MINGTEQCDDGRTPAVSGDGCSDTCQVESGWSCTYDGVKSTCNPVCGDGLVRGTETCDDGNAINNNTDGCTNCQVDLGWECVGSDNSSCSRVFYYFFF